MSDSNNTLPGAKASGRSCAAVGCNVPVSDGVLMCGPHWKMLPQSLKDDVNNAWRDRKAKRPGAYDRHMTACAQAIRNIRRQENP